MHKYISFIVLVCCCSQLHGQSNTFVLSRGKSCSWNGIPVEGVVHIYESNNDVLEVVNKIVQAISLQPNFSIKASDIPDALSTVSNGVHIILYNNDFLKEIDVECHTNWASVSVLAHELGHLYNNDPLDGGNGSIYYELNADEFSGFILHKLGASLEQAKIAAEKYLPEEGTNLYPAKSRRLEAIEKGWRRDEPPIHKSESFTRFIGSLPQTILAKPTNEDQNGWRFTGSGDVRLSMTDDKLYVSGKFDFDLGHLTDYRHIQGNFSGSITFFQRFYDITFPFYVTVNVDGDITVKLRDEDRQLYPASVTIHANSPDDIQCYLTVPDPQGTPTDVDNYIRLILSQLNFTR